MTQIQSIAKPNSKFKQLHQFVHALDFDSIPEDVRYTTRLLILDLIGVLAAGGKLEASRIACNHAVNHWAAGPGAPRAQLLFDGRETSLPGFGFAMATQLDNLDAHDGWQPSKGHAGAALFPGLCAFSQDTEKVSGQEALTAMVIGYEVSYRAAVALHTTVSDYHTSGAWNALGCTAIGARLRHNDANTLRNALGIAEYHAPRSQMMREIANPSMLHDGSGWGAPTGIYALLIAEDGFTGGLAATIEFDDVAHVWEDLGSNWLTGQQYIKPYPVCRWSHAPIDAALSLLENHQFNAQEIDSIVIKTFAYSAELNNDIPHSTAKAQYSLAWPVAAAFVKGEVGVDEVLESSFNDHKIIALVRKTKVQVEQKYESAYPQQRLGSVQVKLKSGKTVDSGDTEASGGPVPQPTQEQVISKFRKFAGVRLSPQRIEKIEKAVLNLHHPQSCFKSLIQLLID